MSLPGRRPLLAGNWKMNKTSSEARTLALQVLAAGIPSAVDVVICPPFTALDVVGEVLQGSAAALGAQNMHEGEFGAFTGEISAPMLVDLGVTYVILGHSERREYFNETDAAVNRKLRSALDHALIPIVAVGETAEEHAAGVTIEKVVRQTRAAFDGVRPAEIARCVVAYEPIWAIGTGNVDTPESADSVMGAIRACVDGLGNARILYGGSMKPENAAALMARPNIDGGLIGGASLTSHAMVACIAAGAGCAPSA